MRESTLESLAVKLRKLADEMSAEYRVASALRDDVRRLEGRRVEYERRGDENSRLASVLEESLGRVERRLARLLNVLDVDEDDDDDDDDVDEDDDDDDVDEDDDDVRAASGGPVMGAAGGGEDDDASGAVPESPPAIEDDGDGGDRGDHGRRGGGSPTDAERSSLWTAKTTSAGVKRSIGRRANSSRRSMPKPWRCRSTSRPGGRVHCRRRSSVVVSTLRI